MTLDGVLQELIQHLEYEDEAVLAWEQIRNWPEGAVEIFKAAGWLTPATPATMVECPGCAENCPMPVHVLTSRRDQPARAYVACDQLDYMGRVKVPMERLQQWQLTRGQVLRWLSLALGLSGQPAKDKASSHYLLGTLCGKSRSGFLEITMTDPACLKVSGHPLPLREVLFMQGVQIKIDQAAISTMVDLPPIANQMQTAKARHTPKHGEPSGNIVQASELDIGSPEWRSETARRAANARHDQPGGSRNKHQRIREIWASGKYTSRDLCAEQECADLRMSFSAARKALRNTPDPLIT